MEAFLTYLLKSAICLAALYIVYWLFLRKDTFFKANRVFLITSIILSFIIPLFQFDFVYNDTEVVYAVILDSITVTAQNIEAEISNHLSTYQKIFIVYITGACIFFVRYIFQLVQLFLIIRKFGVTKIDGMKIVKLDRNYSPFSYFNYIFINEESLSDKGVKEIIGHEKIHVEQRHTLDLILIEALTIIQWFNPFIWLYKNALKGIHEYLADEGLLSSGINKINYQQLLLNHTVGIQVNDLTNNFNQSLIKKRFIMMTKDQSNRIASLKLLLFIPVTAVLVLCFSFTYAQIEDGVNATVNKAIEMTSSGEDNGSEANVAQEQKKKSTQMKMPYDKAPHFKGGAKALFGYIINNIKYPETAHREGVEGTVYVVFKVNADGTHSDHKVSKGVGHGLDEEALRVLKSMPKWVPAEKAGEKVAAKWNVPIRFTLKKQTMDDFVYRVVEDMPKFKGGAQALYEYLGKQINYPKEAQEADIEGRVYLNFIIQADGSVKDVKILRGLSHGLNEEAIRVVSNMPKWIPGKVDGKNVPVLYNLPIRFSLNGESKENASKAAATSEIFTVAEEMPHFPGGEGEMYKFLWTNIRYPEIAHKQGLEGLVYVVFIIEKDGTLSNLATVGIGDKEEKTETEAIIVTALKHENESMSKDKASDAEQALRAEAMRVVNLMPKWTPGKQRGKAVRVSYVLPVKFRLQ